MTHGRNHRFLKPYLHEQYSINECIFGFKGASTSKVIGARNEMVMDDYDGQMIFGDLMGLKLPDIRLTGEEKPRKNITQETCPDRGSNPGPLRNKRACYHLFHSGVFNQVNQTFHCCINVHIWNAQIIVTQKKQSCKKPFKRAYVYASNLLTYLWNFINI